MYDPQIGRFTCLDPLADKFNWVSPYNYAENEPVANIDLWGLQKFNPMTANAQYFRNEFKKELGKIKIHGYTAGQLNSGQVPQSEMMKVGLKVCLIDIPLRFAEGSLVAEGLRGPIEGALTTTMDDVAATAARYTGEGKGVLTLEEQAARVTANSDDLAIRAKEIHSALPEATQRRTTTAVAEVQNPDGTTSRLVGSSEIRLRPEQRAVLNSNETAVTGTGHAETTVINAANRSGQTVNRVAASRPICPECEKAIQNSGATPASPLK